jgi:hypothetical protein
MVATMGSAALLLLVAATALNIYKPKGMTRYGRRKQHEERRRSKFDPLPSRAAPRSEVGPGSGLQPEHANDTDSGMTPHSCGPRWVWFVSLHRHEPPRHDALTQCRELPEGPHRQRQQLWLTCSLRCKRRRRECCRRAVVGDGVLRLLPGFGSSGCRVLRASRESRTHVVTFGR